MMGKSIFDLAFLFIYLFILFIKSAGGSFLTKGVFYFKWNLYAAVKII